MTRVIILFLPSGLLLLPTGARAEKFSGSGMAKIMESLWMPLFSGGIVFQLR